MAKPKRWTKTLIAPAAPLSEAINAIDAGNQQICLVVDEARRLLGTVTDGDVRRGILRGLDLAVPVSEIMNASPRVGADNEDTESLLARMVADSVHQIPLVDGRGRVVGLASIDDLIGAARPVDNVVVLMAGGLGTRLRPLTEDAPKPLLAVGNKPILETILESFVQFGFRHFYISVNYKGEMIKRHFGNGARWGVTIRYMEEDERLGTVGALRLLPERPTQPLVVMNADLLTRVNFAQLLDFHHQQEARATMCVRAYDFQVPFGVVQIEEDRITRIDEKPLHGFFVNAGIYVLDPDLIDLIPEEGLFDMTALFDRILEAGYLTAAFPIREYWLDVGRHNDLDQANWEFRDVFGD